MCRVLTFLTVAASIFCGCTSEPPLLPSREVQTNLLKNVEEVFSQIKTLVSDEGDATDAAVVGDVQKMVTRATDKLLLIQDLALLKLSCQPPPCDLATAHSKILAMIQEGRDCLQGCVKMTTDSIQNNSRTVSVTTGEAMGQGQVLLDTLNRCSKKPGLQTITCYKKVITNDVFPLKVVLLDAIKMHRTGHQEAIAIRKRANECVDYVLETYQGKIAGILMGGGCEVTDLTAGVVPGL